MPLKRLHKAGDVTHNQPSGTDEDFATTSGPTSRKASATVCVVSCASFLTAAVSQTAREGRDVAEPTRSAGYSKPSSASQQQHGRDLCKYPSVIKLSRRLLLHSLQGSSHSNPNNNGQQCSLTQAHNQKRRKISKSVRMTGQMTLLAYSAMMEVLS